MSRIGRAPISVPSSVTVTLSGDNVNVKGPQGSLERRLPQGITISQEGDTLVVSRPDDERRHRALHGLSRLRWCPTWSRASPRASSEELEIVGVGYRVTSSGPDALELALGFSHPVQVEAPDGITFEVPVPTRIIVRGIDKEKVGQVAADIRKLRKPEPYKGKGVRYSGERVQRKAGKAAK